MGSRVEWGQGSLWEEERVEEEEVDVGIAAHLQVVTMVSVVLRTVPRRFTKGRTHRVPSAP